MRLFEAIVRANERAAAGDTGAGLELEEFADALPVVALTCIDPRLNPLLPGALGLPPEQFIWLRNAGNIVTGPQSSTTRSLALGCAVKGGREIVILGHTDCAVRKTTVAALLDSWRQLGVERSQLPEDLVAYFGLFASERQNVITGVEWVRGSPLIGPRVPVHGLLIDITTGRLEWVVNGYQALEATGTGLGSRTTTSPGPSDQAGVGAGAEVQGRPLPGHPATESLRLASALGQVHVVAPAEPPPAPAPSAKPEPTMPAITPPRPLPLPPRRAPRIVFGGKGPPSRK